eukprot:6810787-Prymnesium_polylepis.1
MGVPCTWEGGGGECAGWRSGCEARVCDTLTDGIWCEASALTWGAARGGPGARAPPTTGAAWLR